MNFFETAKLCAMETKPILLEGLVQEKSIEYKSHNDIVTTIDKAVENKIIEIIKDHYPDHDILAEESDAQARQSDFCWIIDPIDGTLNFAHGIPHFAVSIGLEFKGNIIFGLIYNPNNHELFHAEKGKGAFLNNEEIKVSLTTVVSNSLLTTGFPRDSHEKGEQYTQEVAKFLKKSMDIRRAGVASLDLAYVACGRYDGYWERQLKPWDVSAGKVILEEAGGTLSTYSGSDYSVYSDTLVASNSIIHNEMLSILSS